MSVNSQKQPPALPEKAFDDQNLYSPQARDLGTERPDPHEPWISVGFRVQRVRVRAWAKGLGPEV